MRGWANTDAPRVAQLVPSGQLRSRQCRQCGHALRSPDGPLGQQRTIFFMQSVDIIEVAAEGSFCAGFRGAYGGVLVLEQKI